MDNREIDKLIAEKVMGWFPLTDANRMNWWAPSVEELPIWLKLQKNFRPSTDIKDAWLVVEKFEYHKVENDAGWYYCTLANHNTKFFDGDDDKAPIAICKAALKAVGVEV